MNTLGIFLFLPFLLPETTATRRALEGVWTTFMTRCQSRDTECILKNVIFLSHLNYNFSHTQAYRKRNVIIYRSYSCRLHALYKC